MFIQTPIKSDECFESGGQRREELLFLGQKLAVVTIRVVTRIFLTPCVQYLFHIGQSQENKHFCLSPMKMLKEYKMNG